MKRFYLGALLLAAAMFSMSSPSLAQGNSCSGGGIVGMVVGGTTGACYYLKPNSDGSINVTTSGGGGAVTIADGADVTQGAKADAVCGTATGTCSVAALIKFLNSQITAPIPAGTAIIGTTLPGNTLSSAAGCPSTLAISQTTSTDLRTMSATGYICSIVLVIADAETISLVTGTGSVCGTGSAALIGSTTVANGVPLAANGGFSSVSAAPILKMATAADHLCLLQSGSGRLAGFITYSDH